MPDYTQTDIETLLDKMAVERRALLDAAAALSPADAGRVPRDAEGEEQWTAKEQLAHLWEMERSYVAWCRAALEENGVDVSGVSGTPVAIPIEDAPGHGVHELIDALVAERRQTIDFIKSLSLEQFHRTAKTRVFGELTVMQWLRSFYRHDRQHSAQIQGRRSDYLPNFGDAKEPDQRRMRIQQVKARSQTSP